MSACSLVFHGLCWTSATLHSVVIVLQPMFDDYLMSLVVLRLSVKYRDATIIQEPTTVSLNGASS
jgi:hypothetical protein